MTTMTSPTTKAGRELWAEWATEGLEARRWHHYHGAILAIEQEARSQVWDGTKTSDPSLMAVMMQRENAAFEEAVRDYREALERLVRAHDNYFPGAIGFGVVDKAEEVENATQKARALLTASAEEKPDKGRRTEGER